MTALTELLGAVSAELTDLRARMAHDEHPGAEAEAAHVDHLLEGLACAIDAAETSAAGDPHDGALILLNALRDKLGELTAPLPARPEQPLTVAEAGAKALAHLRALVEGHRSWEAQQARPPRLEVVR